LCRGLEEGRQSDALVAASQVVRPKLDAEHIRFAGVFRKGPELKTERADRQDPVRLAPGDTRRCCRGFRFLGGRSALLFNFGEDLGRAGRGGPPWRIEALVQLFGSDTVRSDPNDSVARSPAGSTGGSMSSTAMMPESGST
jgi:hypothetical protein